MSTRLVLVERNGALARVVLNRPDRRNALDDALIDALDYALRQVAAASWCRAVLVTGAGIAFCAGGDIAADSGADVPGAIVRQRRFLQVAARLHEMPKPTVAAVNGAAVGAGFSLALLCDEVILLGSAKLGMGFLTIGLPPDLLATLTVQRRAGWTVATDLFHSGRMVLADEAVRLHLAHEVVEDDVVGAATRRAEVLAAFPPFAFAATKSLLRQSFPATATIAELEALAVGVAGRDP
ncbi:enoyl-CoA hydratase/isomerase family protein (plasmid) [Rhodococcus opacus]|uniref:enoyl-CoA hydratase/isomerase family protein n=1 Tax=Rhodococcus opacus TaxID=37919 RepID=UPI0034D2D0CC|nr:enoyl-CoA hydratase/isomerase family protein [Rhodococcus opacus]